MAQSVKRLTYLSQEESWINTPVKTKKLRRWSELTLPKTKGLNGLSDKLYQILESRCYIFYLNILEQIQTKENFSINFKRLT